MKSSLNIMIIAVYFIADAIIDLLGKNMLPVLTGKRSVKNKQPSEN
ncbi:Uncharacterised protein [Bacillus freudenreichii]|nr:Uncharacterised protein [Bacillus freudenreichii]